jgi:hypothetical protein
MSSQYLNLLTFSIESIEEVRVPSENRGLRMNSSDDMTSSSSEETPWPKRHSSPAGVLFSLCRTRWYVGLHDSLKFPEAEFLDEIRTKVFLLFTVTSAALP